MPKSLLNNITLFNSSSFNISGYTISSKFNFNILYRSVNGLTSPELYIETISFPLPKNYTNLTLHNFFTIIYHESEKNQVKISDFSLL